MSVHEELDPMLEIGHNLHLKAKEGTLLRPTHQT